MENKQEKTVQNNTYVWNWRENTYFFSWSNKQLTTITEKLGHVLQIHVCRQA